MSTSRANTLPARLRKAMRASALVDDCSVKIYASHHKTLGCRRLKVWGGGWSLLTPAQWEVLLSEVRKEFGDDLVQAKRIPYQPHLPHSLRPANAFPAFFIREQVSA